MRGPAHIWGRNSLGVKCEGPSSGVNIHGRPRKTPVAAAVGEGESRGAQRQERVLGQLTIASSLGFCSECRRAGLSRGVT